MDVFQKTKKLFDAFDYLSAQLAGCDIYGKLISVVTNRF
jgi:hypothetical protein